MKLFNKAVCIFVLALVLLACDRGGDGVPQLDPDFVETEDPDRFIQFPNQHPSLPAGIYTVVAGTQTLGDTGSFSITVTRDDDTVSTFDGAWPGSGSGGTDENSVANPRFTYTMPYSGGANFALTTSTSACLYLLDPGGTILHGKSGGNSCSNPTSIDLPTSKINNAAHASAYYQAIDPESTRDTLQKWIAENNFGQTCPMAIPDCETHVIFRDTKDLGYGRDMYLRKNGGGSLSVYVRNFAVDRLKGQQYTTLNLDAAIANEVLWHFGSNAIEFSTYPYGAGEPRDGEIPFETAGGNAPMFPKFFTFKPKERVLDSIEDRLLLVDLDGRGLQSMPGPCISCHGGRALPLLQNGTFPPMKPGAVPGDTFAQIQKLEVDTFGFSAEPGYSRLELEPALRKVNQAVLQTYEAQKAQYVGVQGYWDSDFASELIKGSYSGNVADPNDYVLPEMSFVNYVPMDWRPNNITAMPPAGSDDLFSEVIGKHCMVCHDKRGTDKNRDQSFYKYQTFNEFSNKVELYIFKKGLMPLGLLNFDLFWDNSGPGRAELLASHLSGFSSFDSSGNVIEPGIPIAIPVAPRNTNVPVTVSAEGSPYANSFSWSVIDAPVGSNYTLSGADNMRAVFNADIDGTYTLRLIAYDINGVASDPVDFQMTTSVALPLPSSLRFDTDIRPILQNPPTDCVSCHAAAGEPGVPVYYTGMGADLYHNVIARVYFSEPLDSPLLLKPSNNSHFGGLRAGFDLSSGGDRSNYDLFLNWILQGAPQ